MTKQTTYEPEQIAKFHSRYAVNQETGCWEWTGPRQKKHKGKHGQHVKDYGWFIDSPAPPRNAHRASWLIHHGPIPDGLWVMHKCDNPPCCNPDHLKLGTPKDNVQDAIAKGRFMTAKSMLNRPVTCPHCGVQGRAGNMHRWHMDRCRHRK